MEDQVPDIYRNVRVPRWLKDHWGSPTAHMWRTGIDAKAETMPFEVLPEQVWADNDYRISGRTFKILEIKDGVAICEILTNYDHVQEDLDQGKFGVKDKRGTKTRIQIYRFSHAHARGYRLISGPGTQAA